MKHRNFCNNVLNNKRINIDELANFLSDYIVLFKKEDYIHLLDKIIMLVQIGMIDMKYVVRRYLEMHDKYFVTITDRQGYLIKTNIYDN